jgi:riboflavin synthase alpha subunit
MFTGLVAELGTVLSLTEDAATCRLAIKAHKFYRD